MNMPAPSTQPRLHEISVYLGSHGSSSGVPASIAYQTGRYDVGARSTAAILAGLQVFSRAAMLIRLGKRQVVKRGVVLYVRQPHGILAVETATALPIKGN